MPRITHRRTRLTADPSRVVIRPFHIAPEPRHARAPETARMRRIVEAVRAMDAETVQAELALVDADFEQRHARTRGVYMQRFARVMGDLDLANALSEAQKQLIGAYFCHEYSYAAAALMNPSVIPHFDQSDAGEGQLKFILSMRAVGEGHISSIAFREGVLMADGAMMLGPEPEFAVAMEQISPEPGCDADRVVARRPAEVPLSGVVIFPFTRAQRNGLEDLRMVRFEEDDGSITYLGTYTAYSGLAIASELFRTQDFSTFEFIAMKGAAAQNKGMALFPRRIGGAYAVIGRQDGESLFFLQSDNLTRWEHGEILLKPQKPWELIQIGNCGSPVELDEGWLLLTHGVGAMRKYSIGAVLLDKRDPRIVLARLSKPLLAPSDESREGYVPNVVYTCGCLVHQGLLFLPYGVADSAVAFCTVNIEDLLSEMV
jgi:predicted GH43/DUF377 family glycosyl hydrolase